MPKNCVANVVIALACFGSMTNAFSENYRIEGESRQLLELQSVKIITVRCYCYAEIKLRRSLKDAPMLRFAGSLESVGYHGDAEPPKAIEKELMAFDIQANGDGITVESREWTHMHTAFMIKNLEIVVPPGVELHTESIAFQDLEGRRNK